MDTAFTQLRAVQLSVVAACALTGRSRATHYRRTTESHGVCHPRPQLGPQLGPPPEVGRRPRRPPPCTITEAEREQILALLNSQPYQDLAIPQVWARELDEGRYWCSQSSMYRIARAAGQTRERRAQATHPPRVMALAELGQSCSPKFPTRWRWSG
jgi:putative transposase